MASTPGPMGSVATSWPSSALRTNNFMLLHAAKRRPCALSTARDLGVAHWPSREKERNCRSRCVQSMMKGGAACFPGRAGAEAEAGAVAGSETFADSGALLEGEASAFPSVFLGRSEATVWASKRRIRLRSGALTKRLPLWSAWAKPSVSGSRIWATTLRVCVSMTAMEETVFGLGGGPGRDVRGGARHRSGARRGDGVSANGKKQPGLRLKHQGAGAGNTVNRGHGLQGAAVEDDDLAGQAIADVAELPGVVEG